MRPYLVVLCLLAGCATGPKDPIRAAWTPSQEHWEKVRHTGTNLNKRDGTRIFLPGQVIDNILTVKAKVEEASGVTTDLAIVETTYPNAFATHRDGRPVIALSTAYLDQLGKDLDALATTIGHELAHLHLGHSGAVAAGYDPCGKARTVAVFSKLRGPNFSLLSTHPSYGERSELANEYSRQANNKPCDGEAPSAPEQPTGRSGGGSSQ